ncbi:ribonuclease Z [Mycobacterium paragordonae]|uniref:Ribonuclease Z n=1 Tax=Mycobacterium paragordonae TaxID=1389713 RepID=A0A4R5WYT9_9MYCO|nr:ribonuclease Z [Mycobacterium paragordonae]MDP7737847.1 ribonuclease Z [Mycobacterium paragordonae]TDL02235.1 ribonuclease Z [Mycobacterium paragordonae]TDL12967.1 ribonuclease Z [Mycobacterium paragordonae]
MSVRELIVLGTASQAPTRYRNQNGYLLRWDGEGLMFDPGEGTQRQMLLAGVAMSGVTRLCITHFHGDHCLGVPGIIQRLSLDEAQHRVHAYFPASGQQYFSRLHHACIFHDRADIYAQPVAVDGPIAAGEFGVLEARRLEHSADAIGYRLIEPDGRRFVPALLERFGLDGPAVGQLHAAGSIDWGGRTVDLSEVSEARPGQRFALVMDTRLCDAVYALADGVDMLVIEATFLSRDSDLAARYGHLTARQAARVAAECGVRRLVLTHFSQRYTSTREHHDEAAEVFAGDLVIAEDLARIRVPERL